MNVKPRQDGIPTLPDTTSFPAVIGCTPELAAASLRWGVERTTSHFPLSMLGRPGPFKKFEQSSFEVASDFGIVALGSVAPMRIYSRCAIQMRAIPPMRSLRVNVPLGRCAGVFCQLKLRDALGGRRLDVLAAHQYQNRMINTITNDFEGRAIWRVDREASGIECDASGKTLATRQNAPQINATMAPQENPTCAMRFLSTNGRLRR